jgi:hypothetical protein
LQRSTLVEWIADLRNALPGSDFVQGKGALNANWVCAQKKPPLQGAFSNEIGE